MEMAAILISRKKEISMPEGSLVGDLLWALEKSSRGIEHVFVLRKL